MAYACPVCETIAPDGEHLAHHLAIVGMTRSEAHEAWLDEHAPGWQEASPEELAATATEHAEQVDHELADEAAGGRPDVGHAHDHGGDHGRRPSDATSSTAGGDETAAVLAEAREMTQRMLDEDDADGDDADGVAAAGTDDAAAGADDAPAGTDGDKDGGDAPETATETDSDE